MITRIIPTLNEERFVNKLLTSIKNQFYKKYEIIVVDAGSVDDTEQVVKKFKHRFKRLDFIRVEEKNPSKQRNIGAKVAVNDVLVFLDADTVLYYQHFLSKIAKRFRFGDKYGGATVYTAVDPKEATYGDNIFHVILNIKRRFWSHLGIYLFNGGSMIAKKDCFDKVRGFNENLFLCAGMDLYKKLGRVAKISNPGLYVYESPRRYRRCGWVKMLWLWKINWLWYLLFKKSYNKRLESVR